MFRQAGCLLWGMFSEYGSIDCEGSHPQVDGSDAFGSGWFDLGQGILLAYAFDFKY